MKLNNPTPPGGYSGSLNGALNLEKDIEPKLATAAEQGRAGTGRAPAMGGIKPPAAFAKTLGLDPSKNIQKPMLQKLQFHPNAAIASTAKNLLGQF